MRTIPRLSHVLLLFTLTGLCALLSSWLAWPDALRHAEFSALMLLAVAASSPPWQPVGRSWPTLRVSFVVDFTTLMLFGLHPAMAVAACGIVARNALDPQRARVAWPRFVEAMTVMVSLQAAAWTYAALGGTLTELVWPWHAVPVAGAAAAYCVVTSASADVLAPLASGQPLDRVLRGWAPRLLQGAPVHFVAVSVAAAVMEIVVSGQWGLLAVAAAPLYLAHGVYSEHVTRLEQAHRRGDVLESLHDGVCILDRRGTVTLWNDTLEMFLECPRARALGRPLRDAVPRLAATELARIVDDVARSGKPRTVSDLRLRGAHAVRLLRVKLIPVTDGIAMVWQDVTEHNRAVQALQRHGERLGLAAEAANDGLWEWDLNTQQFYVTGRWKAMVGLPAHAVISKPNEWFERVHADDLGPLKEAIDAHIAGKTDRFQHEHRLRHEDGTYRFFQCRGGTARAAGGRATRIAGSMTDTTDLALTQERLRNAVYLDPLTGLWNRAVFVEGLGRRLKESQRRRGSDLFALLYLDLDRFKVVNDSLGHLVGDELLIAVSRRLESCLRQGDVLARLGGDEFAILLNGLQTGGQANVIAMRVQESLSKPFSIGGREVFTSASIGIAFGVSQYTGPDEMMHDADTAMYQAKTHGKARHEVFDADMDARARDRLGLENDLRRAVSNNDMETHYQPIVSLASGMCIGFESLVRWTRDGKPVSPAVFVPIAEELGLIERLGTRVLEEACRTFVEWQKAFPHAGLECITVNVSSRQLMQQNFLSVVERAVRQSGLEPSALRIEITETALMTDPDVAAQVLSQLRDFGVKIYLDDFGTGYSSLSHLHKLPVDALKIDRSFVRSLLLPDRPAIVESILALARTLHTSVVAEGIEADMQARELERLGCTHAQGFLFSRPISKAAVEDMLVANRPLGPKCAPVMPTLAAS